MPTLCLGTQRQSLLWLPCFRKNEKERKSIRGEDTGVTKRAYMWIGGEDESCFPPCVRDVRVSPLPPTPAPPPALTLHWPVQLPYDKAYVRSLFSFAILSPTTGRRQRHSDHPGAYKIGCERRAQQRAGKTWSVGSSHRPRVFLDRQAPLSQSLLRPKLRRVSPPHRGRRGRNRKRPLFRPLRPLWEGNFVLTTHILARCSLSFHHCHVMLRPRRAALTRRVLHGPAKTPEIQRLAQNMSATESHRQNNGHPEREEIPFRPLLSHGAWSRELVLQTLFRCTDLISRSDIEGSRDTHSILLFTRVDYYCANL